LPDFGIAASEVARVQSVSPEAVRLARRLRQLRTQQWPDAGLTQDKLARVLSAEVQLSAATVSSWESASSPKLPPRRRLQAYARFFATQRSIEGSFPRLVPLEQFTPDEMANYRKLEAELLGLRKPLSGEDPDEEEIPLPRSWHFTDEGPITLVCGELPSDQKGPLADPRDPNHTELQGYADMDALAELNGHIRAENPQLIPRFKIPSRVDNDDLTGHIILIGGIAYNQMTGRLSKMAKLPMRQVEHPLLDSGEIFVAEMGDEEKEFWPQWGDDERKLLAEDVGLLARVPNPLNSNRTLTICNGIHSRGVYGAVRTLTDTHLRGPNERYISASFGNSTSFAILMSVQVIENKAVTPDFNIDGVVLYQWPGPSA
jgi:transcriptional regulator with XRE-family HTH domain